MAASASKAQASQQLEATAVEPPLTASSKPVARVLPLAMVRPSESLTHRSRLAVGVAPIAAGQSALDAG